MDFSNLSNSPIESLLPSGLTQEEQDASDEEFNRTGLTTDDIIWFTYGERTVRSWNPNNEIIDDIINQIHNKNHREAMRQQRLMVEKIKYFTNDNNLEELNLMIRMGKQILDTKIKNKK